MDLVMNVQDIIKRVTLLLHKQLSVPKFLLLCQMTLLLAQRIFSMYFLLVTNLLFDPITWQFTRSIIDPISREE